MGKFWRASIIGIGLMLVFGVWAADEAKAQVILREILMRMDKHSKSLLSLKADLRMVKDFPVIGEIDTSEGAITLLPKTGTHGNYVRIDWETPRAENIVMMDDMFEVYVPDLRTMTRGKAARSTSGSLGFFNLLSMSKRQILENYVIDYFGQEGIAGGSQTWHLRVTPKNRVGYYRFSDIWVDGDGMPLQVRDSGGGFYTRPVDMELLGLTRAVMAMVKRTEEDTGLKISCDIDPVYEVLPDTTTITITRIKKNETIDASVFKINAPKGTKVIKG